MTEKLIGVIEHVSFGRGGYQDCMLGLNLVFKSGCVGVSAFINGGWTLERSAFTKWTEEERSAQQSDMCRKIIKLLEDAKVGDITKLKGKPVRIETDGHALLSWEILTEAIL